GGEEPIDHLQKSLLRGGVNLHPMVHRVMQIHVAEEARHISFAHEYLRKNVPSMHPVTKTALSVAFPVAMRVMLSMIATPPKEFVEKFDIPAEVMREAYWDSPESQVTMRDVFGDVRALVTDTGMMNPLAKLTWRLLGIAGPASRYRSEPARRTA
uniref:diiron oxygenase n=1 Tax=Nocardia neocaledoniensis TaxID=236511 RepID=UPI00245692A5